MNIYEVCVLFDGYSCKDEEGIKANCTCTLIKGPKNVIVDTMTAWDGSNIERALNEHGLKCCEIDYVICTHGHSDHIGCNYLFQNAVHIVGHCISHKDKYMDFNFQSGEPYIIDDCIQIIGTPGHTYQDITVLTTTPDKGVVAITGDLFENENDIKDDNIWKSVGSDSIELQEMNRKRILNFADYIVPGHGAMFKVADILNEGSCLLLKK